VLLVISGGVRRVITLLGVMIRRDMFREAAGNAASMCATFTIIEYGS
jgi:hypothetical protein